MNIFRSVPFRLLAFSLALPLFAFWVGCEVDSTTGVPSDNAGTIYNYAGLYLHPNNTETNIFPLVYPTNGPSGTPITSLRLLQYGNVLEAYDSANQTWSGKISSIQSGTASFSLVGRTTAGQTVEVAGTLVYAAQNSKMDASWIEPNFYGTLSAQADVAPAATNSPSLGVQISPKSTTQSSREFIASGGSGSYTWSVSSTSVGTVSPTTGSRVTYTSKLVTGTNTITVTDANDITDSDSATAIYIAQ